MIVASLGGWAAFLLIVGFATALGIGIARLLPITSQFRQRDLVYAFGCGLGPFLLGLASVAALSVLPGASHVIHYAAVVVMLATALMFVWWRKAEPLARSADLVESWTWVLVVLVSGFVALLLFHALAIPLIQSDALEYSFAAKRLYLIRAISGYPPIDPVNDPSGFYGPWTHPPLYPALIYLAAVCQGNATEPALMRLLSPWALLATGGMVFALVRASGGRRAAYFAVLFLFAAPLLFLGADSALLDAFSACALALTLTACVAFPTWTFRGSFALGLVIGAGMWAHSQTILLVPLALFALLALNGSSNLRGMVQRASVVVLGALAIGALPYVWNFQRLGVFISDNPPVFALPALHWDSYFRSARDFDSLSARIQYGIFKGWFAPEAYALTFWFMTIGLIDVARRRIGARDSARAAPLPADQRSERIETAGIAVLACYLGGVVASTAAGIILMIKTERYWLMIMPIAALFAGLAAKRLTDVASAKTRLGRTAHSVAFAAIVLMFAGQLAVMARYRLGVFHLSVRDIALPLEKKLQRWSPYRAVEFLRATPADSLILTFKPSDTFYTGRKTINYLDPRMIPVYQERDPGAAIRMMRGLGIRYVHMPDYTFPPFYRTALVEGFANARYTRLEHSVDGYQVYYLRDSAQALGHPEVCAAGAISPDSTLWSWQTGFVFGGRKRLMQVSGGGARLTAGVPPARRPLLFQRDHSSRLFSPVVPISRDVTSPCGDARQLRFAVELSGRGYATVYLEQFGPTGNVLVEESLGNTEVGPDSRSSSYSRRFLLRPDAVAVRAIIEHRGVAEIGVVRADLHKIRAN